MRRLLRMVGEAFEDADSYALKPQLAVEPAARYSRFLFWLALFRTTSRAIMPSRSISAAGCLPSRAGAAGSPIAKRAPICGAPLSPPAPRLPLLFLTRRQIA
jgi:hypothetical protein